MVFLTHFITDVDMVFLNLLSGYKKLKKIKRPSFFYFINDAHRSRPQLQADLLRDFGDIVRLPHYSPCFVINHPDYVKQVLLTRTENYIKFDDSYRGLVDVIGNGIITNNGKKWKAQRLNLSPFFQPQKYLDYIPTMISFADDLATHWQHYAETHTEFNCTKELMSLTLKISTKNFLSESIDDNFIRDTLDFNQSVNHYVSKAHYYFQFLPLPSLIRLKKEKKCIETYLLTLITKRRNTTIKPVDLLTQLISMKTETGEPPSDDEILGELKNFLVASYETVAHAMTWTLYYLIQHPQVLAKVKTELQDISLSENAVPYFPYLKQVIEESLRLQPPAWMMTRRAIESDQIANYLIPNGSHVLICPYAIHRHPLFWENPESFIPERFSAENKATQHRYSYLPFGAGPRTCIAAQLALLEAQIILATLLTRFDFSFSQKKKIKPQALVTLGIKDGLRLIAKLSNANNMTLS